MKYLVRVWGGNIKIIDAGPRMKAAPSLGRVTTFGCVTTRVVTAASVDEACKLAIASARQELEPSIANDHSDPPIFEIEKVREGKDDDFANAPTKGFTFYTEERSVH